QEEERKRVAHELHDTIGSLLAAVQFRLHGVQKAAQGQPYSGALEKATDNLARCMEENRRIQLGLRPGSLDKLGLAPTLSWFAREYRNAHPAIHLELELGLGDGDVAEPLKTALYRIAEEALNNAAAHSRAARVALRLVRTSEGTEMTVRDDGIGFDPDGVLYGGTEGVGLSAMQARAELSGGVLEIDSAEGTGTTIRVFWPADRDG
ncbi:MAG TPA: ATP-binding protein, partial [Thermodesulfobacteriota bacterium]|nr:ATP-binding protein [Thermodesulfobacteriota bacterium]